MPAAADTPSTTKKTTILCRSGRGATVRALCGDGGLDARTDRVRVGPTAAAAALLTSGAGEACVLETALYGRNLPAHAVGAGTLTVVGVGGVTARVVRHQSLGQRLKALVRRRGAELLARRPSFGSFSSNSSDGGGGSSSSGGRSPVSPSVAHVGVLSRQRFCGPRQEWTMNECELRGTTLSFLVEVRTPCSPRHPLALMHGVCRGVRWRCSTWAHARVRARPTPTSTCPRTHSSWRWRMATRSTSSRRTRSSTLRGWPSCSVPWRRARWLPLTLRRDVSRRGRTQTGQRCASLSVPLVHGLAFLLERQQA
jgi:hypothetical protein